MTVSIGPSTGAALNPAKIIGPGFIGKAYWAQVPYLIGIFGGTLLGGILCEFVLFKRVESSGDPRDEDSKYERELPMTARGDGLTEGIRDDREVESGSNSGSSDLGEGFDVSQVISQFSDDDHDEVM